MSSRYDIVVIGGGIVGLGVFHQLTLNGYQNVLLVEKSSQIITGASCGNSGILHTGFDTKPDTLESKLVQRGYYLYQSLSRYVPLPVNKIGAYMIARTNDDVAILKSIIDIAHKNGVRDIEEISSSKLYEREPHLDANALCALYIPGESIVDPLTLPLILYTQSKLLGGHIQMNTEIINGEFNAADNYWTLNNGELKCRIVINCAGLYGDHVEEIRLKQVNSTKTSTFTIHPRMGQFSVYSSVKMGSILNSIILPIPTQFTKGIIVYPNLFSQIIVGPTAQTQDDRCHAPIRSDVTSLLHEKIIELIPRFSEFDYQHIGSYTGIRPATEHSDYQIESFKDMQWICCGGIRSTGLTASLAIGEYICEKLKDFNHLKDKISCEGYSSEKFFNSVKRLKEMFNPTPLGLQPKFIEKHSNVSTTGDVQLGANMKSTDLSINCDGEIITVSHSLLKLAWTTTAIDNKIYSHI